MEKGEVLNTFLTLVLTIKTYFQESQARETWGIVRSKEYLPLVEEDEVREHLSRLDVRKSMGPDGLQSQVLRELTGEVPEDWRKANVTPVFKNGKEDPGNYRLVILTLIPGKVMKQLILEMVSRHMKEKVVISSSQHVFTKEMSSLTNLITFYDEMTGLDQRQEAQTKTWGVLLNMRKHFFTVMVTEHWHRLPREVLASPLLDILKSHMDIWATCSSKACGTVSHKILTENLMKYQLDEQAVRWIENWLKQPGPEGGDQWHEVLMERSVLVPIPFNIFINDLDDGTECTLSKFADDAKLGEVADMSQGHAAMQRDLDRLEKWTDRKLIKFNKGKCQVLPLGRNDPLWQCMLADDQLENSSAEKDMERVADSKLNKSQNCVHVAKNARDMPGCIRSLASRPREVNLPLFSALGSPLKKRHGDSRESATNGHTDGEGTGASPIGGKTGKAGLEK
ncbi:hypothetical protein QYF61_017226 [Mycteria americana]|uniref:Rna-directed dna polymerase from mobile element jockey-like n=1 Tax=Mycteria americana TaxID=33587 RepID=A0AAN7N2D5_MYCAM|nr:hypothetical protein QYF61_017226 [Mycteria americana]